MTDETPADEPFSDQLERWLGSDDPKTLGALGDVFAEKSFAVGIMLLMLPSALPIPTGGLTHVFEVVSVLLALQMVAGRTTPWIPARWRERPLGDSVTGKALPFALRRVRWFERWARPRGSRLLERRTSVRVLGLLLGVLVVFTALAPPFSGLDTIPALGVVLVALGIVLEDVLFVLAGVVVGAVGSVIVVTLGAVALRFVTNLW